MTGMKTMPYGKRFGSDFNEFYIECLENYIKCLENKLKAIECGDCGENLLECKCDEPEVE